MKNILIKDTFRDIKKSLGRFISILIIVALGVAFFVGVRTAPLTMKSTADKYYDDTNLMDIKLMSTLGLTDKDVEVIKNIDGVEGVFPTYSTDVIFNNDSNELVLKIHSLDLNTLDANNKDFINRPVLLDGRFPEKSGEVLVEDGMGIEIGSKINLESGTDKPLTDTLKTTEYIVVGKVRTSYYLSHEKGSSNLGNGAISSFIIIPKDDFKLPSYTEMYITVNDAKLLDSHKEEYFDVVGEVKEKINNIAEERNKVRYEEVASVIPEELKDSIKMPQWIALDRNAHYSYVDYSNAAGSIDAISKVFPVFFFLVAALVSLTTMTRMVDEQRVNIGTLKALGYSKFDISLKFLIYALGASLIGSILGSIVGNMIFPSVVMKSYAMMYVLPKEVKVISFPIIGGATLIAVLVTTLSTYLAANKELRENPTVLMRPRAPKEGKRILIERIPFIWNRLNFIGKVTVRNIFRYKKRFFMTVFGIAGCTALIVTGFGLKDSIKAVSDKQFGEIYKYEITIDMNDKTLEDSKKGVGEFLLNDDRVNHIDFAKKDNAHISLNDVEKPATIMVLHDIQNIDKLIDIRNRTSKEKIVLDDNGIVITEKLAILLDIKVGDSVVVKNSKNVDVQVKVLGIAEQYVANNLYMTSKLYENLFKEEVIFNSILTDLVDDVDQDSLIKDIISKEGVKSVVSSTVFKENFSKTIKSLNYVVMIMIVSAGALAFVVLYNLTNVNISERMREIATIKVLGFYDKEVSAYIYRENLILTFIGTLVGVLLGKVIHKFIMVTVEMENMMFGRSISIMSYVLAGGITILFALIVNFAMYYKLKNVKMVESLKSVD